MADREEKEVSKRPEDSDFKQQRLPAWQPLLTPNWVILTFLVVGLAFIPVGIVIVLASDSVVELSQRYDTCAPVNVSAPATCQLTFDIEEDMEGPVYLYYELSNYYQNHRRYVKSRSDQQLRGEAGGTGTCSPLEDGPFNASDPNSATGTLYPCGLVAFSTFNDTFEACTDDTFASCASTGPEFSNRGIAWQSDIDNKFSFSPSLDAAGVGEFNGVELPHVEDEEFIVWMRTAGLPTFRKLHRKIPGGLRKGQQFFLSIVNQYPVHDFDGEKRAVLSTTSWLGGKNRFLGWAYIAVAVVCLLLALAFHIKNHTSPRKLGDMEYFQWAGAGAAAAGGH